VENKISSKNIPKTDSIQKLAKFWDNNDLTAFEDEFEEVTEPVFVRDEVLEIHLSSDETKIVEGIAKSKGVAITKLVHDWIIEKAQFTQ
jgi:hypothetical protein